MKTVSKTLTIYTYKILKVNISTNTMEVVNEICMVEPMSKDEAAHYSDNGFVVIRDEQRKTFSIPADAFILACREYANKFKEK